MASTNTKHRTLLHAAALLVAGLGAGMLVRAATRAGDEPAAPPVAAEQAAHAGHATPEAGDVPAAGHLAHDGMEAMEEESGAAAPAPAAGRHVVHEAGISRPAVAPDVAIDLENPECPIMGGDTEAAVHTHWKGLRVRFCCAMCEEDFLKDPEAKLDELGIQYRDALEAMRRYSEAEGAEKERLLEDMRARFRVVEAGSEG